MKRNYIVRLTDEERKTCDATIDRLKGSSQKARWARILSQVDADGPNWKNGARYWVGEGSEADATPTIEKSSVPRCSRVLTTWATVERLCPTAT